MKSKYIILKDRQDTEKFIMWDSVCIKGFPSGSIVNTLLANAGARALFLGWEDSPGEGNGNSLQYPCLGNPMERGI